MAYGDPWVMGSPPFVRDDLRQELLDTGLVGLEFLPLRWDQPEKAKAVFWQMSSHVTMPPCLLPRVPISAFEPILYYDDGGGTSRRSWCFGKRRSKRWSPSTQR